MSDKFLVNQDYDNKVQKAVKAANRKFFWAKLLHKQLDPSDEDSIQAFQILKMVNLSIMV